MSVVEWAHLVYLKDILVKDVLNSEFELIDLFKNIGSEYYKDNGIIISPGDDCAVFKSNKPIVTSIDASVEGVHFPKNAKPSDIAYRSIAVALSDILRYGMQTSSI